MVRIRTVPWGKIWYRRQGVESFPGMYARKWHRQEISSVGPEVEGVFCKRNKDFQSPWAITPHCRSFIMKLVVAPMGQGAVYCWQPARTTISECNISCQKRFPAWRRNCKPSVNTPRMVFYLDVGYVCCPCRALATHLPQNPTTKTTGL